MTRRTPLPRRPFATAAAVTAIVLSSVLIGTGTSYAFWSASASTNVATTTGDVEVAVGTFATTNLANHSLSATFPVTVTNNTVQHTASTTTSLTVKLDANPVGFAANAQAIIWDQAIAACTAASPTPLATGTWANLQLTGITMAKGATKTYCVRTSLNRAIDAAAASGSNSFGARVSATAAVGSFTDTDSRTVTQATEYIYPLGAAVNSTSFRIHVGSIESGLCLDVSGSGGNGTRSIAWNCHGDANQQWQFSAASTGYLRLTPQHSTGLRLGATSTASGATVTVQTSSTSNPLQEWQLQQTGAGRFQLVNRSTGYCLTAPALVSQDVAMTQAPCSGAAVQQFLPRLRDLTCSVTTSGNPRTLALTWASTSGSRTLYLDGNAVTPDTSTNTGLSYQISRNDYAHGTHPFRVEQGGVIVGTGTFTMDGNSRLSSCAVTS